MVKKYIPPKKRDSKVLEEYLKRKEFEEAEIYAKREQLRRDEYISRIKTLKEKTQKCRITILIIELPQADFADIATLNSVQQSRKKMIIQIKFAAFAEKSFQSHRLIIIWKLIRRIS